ncbi:ABC transporter ATP-binding protein [Jeotgalibacillus proteolyticus]|uniref:Sodium ABC transporter ATP-binding protein n=1 Tax=Jeotgalibacillus proteolyticus TaxID=2082395 RepID=A0A2S5GH89_9BACL|nr:ABC transporter ATP-binding protein [Jeotgalibacillus proteolyticus]PPA72417.1 sodium ABC transporter ATP-binding protein [Jeotgalibacillus proteolyticus]
MSLEIKNVTKKFGEQRAVNDLSLTIPENTMFGFLGANGAGKTTTFRMMLGLIDASAGVITWNNQPIGYESSQQVGYLPEERGLYPKMKVKDQIVYLARLRGMGKKEAEKELVYWLERFKVPDYKNKRVEELSKGNQQKIQFIASIVHKPSLIILDEPFSGLDPVNVELLKEAVHDIHQKGATIIFSSHRMEHVEELCENVCIIHKGSPVLHGEIRNIKRSFGKKNLLIDSDQDLTYLSDFPGVVKLKKRLDGVKLQIENEEVSQFILKEIYGKGFIRQFSLEEPALNDIFIEKVGASFE